MSEMEKDIIFVTDRSAEFIMSLFRIGHNQQFKEMGSEYGIKLNKEISNYVEEIINDLSGRHKDILERYFSNYLGIGLALISKDHSVKKFILDISNLNNIELAYYMLITWGEIEFTIDELEKVVNENKIFTWIEENFAVSDEDKWQIMKVLNCPEGVKEELLDLLNYYYEHFYKDKEEEVETFLKDYIGENRQDLINTFKIFLDYFISPTSKEEYLSSNKEIGALVSYFLEFGSACATGTESLVLGYRYPETAEKILNKDKDLLQYTSFFKVLADDTRLKVLLEINEGPKYLAQLAEIMDSSNPAISYHINKLMEIGLIEIESSDNRIYYQVKKEKVTEIIEVLDSVFL